MFQSLSIFKIFSIIIYSFIIIGNFIFTLFYLFNPKFMKYHSFALKTSWENVEDKYKILIIALMRTVGGGMLSCTVLMGIILYIPLLQGRELWANYAICISGLCLSIPSVVATVSVKIKTSAETPFKLLIASTGFIIIAFFLYFLN